MRARRGRFSTREKAYEQLPADAESVRPDCWWVRRAGCAGIAKHGLDRAADRFRRAAVGCPRLLESDAQVVGEVLLELFGPSLEVLRLASPLVAPELAGVLEYPLQFQPKVSGWPGLRIQYFVDIVFEVV